MEISGLLQALGIGLTALLSGCIVGFIGGAVGGWISGYRDPLLRMTDASWEVRSGIAIDGAKFGSAIGLLAGAVSGVISASLAGIVSPWIPALVFGALF